MFKQCALQCFNVWFVFTVTLTLFPTVQSNIKRFDKDFVVPEDYYSDVMCFMTFNVTALIGSWLATMFRWVRIELFIIMKIRTMTRLVSLVYNSFSIILLLTFQPSKRYVIVPILLRAAFVPLFFMCRYTPSDDFPLANRSLVYIENDWIFFGIAVAMGITSGYFSSVAMMFCSR